MAVFDYLPFDVSIFRRCEHFVLHPQQLFVECSGCRHRQHDVVECFHDDLGRHEISVKVLILVQHEEYVRYVCMRSYEAQIFR